MRKTIVCVGSCLLIGIGAFYPMPYEAKLMITGLGMVGWLGFIAMIMLSEEERP